MKVRTITSFTRSASQLTTNARRNPLVLKNALINDNQNSQILPKESPIVNEVGIQYLSRNLHEQLFPENRKANYKKVLKKPSKYDLIKVALSQRYLQKFNLLNKKTSINDPIQLSNLPKLAGNLINEHFMKLALHDSSNYLQYANMLCQLQSLPKRPKEWLMKPGWYRYDGIGAPMKVDYPLEEILVFDVESMYQVSKYAVMATCVSPVAWYGWVSPFLTGDSPSNDHLIPMNTRSSQKKLIVGHNVCYDRARILEEYSLQKSNAFFLDTLSLHVAVTGICSRQRSVWTKFNNCKKIDRRVSNDVKMLFNENEFMENLLNEKFETIGNESFLNKYDFEIDHKQENPWVSLTSTNSLAEVADLHCGIRMNKQDRDYFKTENVIEIRENFQKLMHYCARDVEVTHAVFGKVFPAFKSTCPHPVSFSALRHINSIFLPTTYQTWETYIRNAESLYQNNRVEIEKKLADIALELVKKFQADPESVLNDYWYGQLNWTVAPIKIKKDGTPFKKQKMPGFPEWYKSLFPSANSKIKLSIRTRIVPILLRLKWEGLPLIWTESKGWCFKISASRYSDINDLLTKKNYTKIDDFTADPNFEYLTRNYEWVYFKVPHPNGPSNRTTNLALKSYLKFYEKNVLSSEYDIARRVLELNASASYWISARERIMNQFVVYEEDNKSKSLKFLDESNRKVDLLDPLGIIIPQILPMGTITRRAVENSWLTASNVKKNRIGSELKTKIQAPEGFCFVGADVDSEELWIASLLSDSIFKIHGGSAIGWMTLEGNKLEKTDLHSKTAEILGISRNEAKIFNYSRIYGAGLKHTSTLLKQFNPKLTDKEVIEICNNLFDSTKGKTLKLQNSEKKKLENKGIHLSKIWFGGSESVLFNKLENLAETSVPQTPVLKAGITEALKKENLNANSFLPSRINWAIQSSGVDYLHLLIISMEYLIKRYKLDARLCITVHDEIRYMVRNDDKYKACLLLQISNLWTRAIFCEQLGIKDIPQSCAFFSQVDIDSILRKEVDTPCETPSNKNPKIPNGESLDIVALLEVLKKNDKGEIDWLYEDHSNIDFKNIKLDPNLVNKLTFGVSNSGSGKSDKTVAADTENSCGNLLDKESERLYMEMQIENDLRKVKDLMKKLISRIKV